ncbi:MAG: hypothetical protein Kow00129_14620 [Thermoleophilia bacterium]
MRESTEQNKTRTEVRVSIARSEVSFPLWETQPFPAVPYRPKVRRRCKLPPVGCLGSETIVRRTVRAYVRRTSEAAELTGPYLEIELVAGAADLGVRHA